MSIAFVVFLLSFSYILWNFYHCISNFIRVCLIALIRLRKIPGPPALPFIGSAYLFKWDSEAFSIQLEEWAKRYLCDNDKSRGLILAWVGPIPLIFAAAKESARSILESNVNISKPSQYQKLCEWIGTGLLTSTNRKWFVRRKLLTPAFHFNILQGYQDIFSQKSEIFVQVLAKEAEKGIFFDAFPFIKRCALDIICETAMGTDIDSQNGRNNSYVEAVVRLSAIIWQHERFPWLWIKPIWYLSGLGYEFEDLIRLTTDFTRNVIAQRKKEMEYQEYMNESDKANQKAFLDLLLFMQKENRLSDEDIREEVDTFMFEGHDTTASSIGFTIWWLGQKPDCQRLVQQEVDEIFGDSDRMPTTDDVRKMIYLEKCIKESLRLMPSVPLIARHLDEDVDMHYCTLPKGMTVVVAPMACQRDPREFEFPDDFHPEHFDTEKTVKRDPYAYIPFSAGPRNCIGQKFAILEEKIVLSYVFRRFNVETEVPAPGNRPIPEIILKPTLGFSLRLTNRTNFF